jgi:hypothetical protein
LFSIGWHTSRVSVVLWILVVSTHNRNPLVCDIGDAYLAAILFWSMFLPLGARFSVDCALQRHRSTSHSDRYFGASSLALVVQIALFSFVSAVQRTGRDWRDGSAMYYALSLDSHATAVGLFVVRSPLLAHALTFAFKWLEWTVSFGAIAPVFNWHMRLIAVVCSIALHLGFGLLLELGMWVWVPPAASLALLPSQFWTWWRRLLWPRTATLRLRYGAGRLRVRDALLCARELLLLGDMLHVEAQSSDNDGYDLIEAVIDARDKPQLVSHGVDAVLAVAHASLLFDVLWTLPLGEFLLRRTMSAKVVRRVASFVFGEPSNLAAAATEAIVVRHEPQPFVVGNLQAKWSDAVRLVLHWFSGRSLVREALVLCMLCATLMAALPEEFRSLPATRTAVTWVRFARLEPRYQLFVPSVPRDDGWFVTNGELVDGTKIEVWPQELTSGRGAAWLVGSVLAGGNERCCTSNVVPRSTLLSKPKFVSQQFGGVMRWRNAWRAWQTREHERERLQLAQFLCRTWNAHKTNANEMLAHFEIHWVREATLPSYHVGVPEAQVLWAHQCVSAKLRQ